MQFPRTRGPIGLAVVGIFAAVAGVVKMLSSTQRDIRGEVVRLVENERANPDVDKYWAEILPGSTPKNHPPSWCGALILWALHKAGLTNAPWKVGAGFIYPLKLARTSSPQVGDIAYFDKFQHHALVSEVLPGKVALLNGNSTRSARYPEGAITRSIKSLGEVTAFFSIDSLIAAKKAGR
jgi:hypothetical protein